MTKIKGAIEVYLCSRRDDCYFTEPSEEFNGLAFTHTDLEAYVQERIKKHDEEPYVFNCKECGHTVGNGNPLNHECSLCRFPEMKPEDFEEEETFEDFKKEQG